MTKTRHEALWSLKGLDILIVDDYPQMRTMLREMLVSCGANQIESVKNGEDAIAAMAVKKPDIVLCDYHLGEGKDGQQVLEEAREHDYLPYSAIFILITAENTLSMVMGVVEQEPDAYLTKPFTREVLQTRIRRLQQKKSNFAAISVAVERREYLAAAQLCDDTLREHPRYAADLLRIKADALRRAGDHQACEKLFRQVLSERELAWAYLGLGQALHAQQRLPESREALEQAIAMKDNFVVAYDALAKVQQALELSDDSEKTLQRAVELSPKNLRRQQALATTALANGHLEVAQQAYRQAIREGRNSLFASPADFAGLARVHVQNGEPEKAVQALSGMQRQYSSAAASVQLQMAVAEAEVHQKLGQDAASRKAAATASKLLQQCPDELSRDEMMSLAQTCMDHGDANTATELVQKLVRANHEDEVMLERAQQIFSQAGMADRGAALIDDEREAMIELNNEAVALLEKGDVKQSSSMLLRAAQAMPENPTINLNAVQALLQLMQGEGGNWRILRQAQELLAGVSHVASGQQRYQDLMQQSRDLQQKLGAAA